MSSEIDPSIRRAVAYSELIKGFDRLVAELADGPLRVRRRKRSEDFVLISAQGYARLMERLEDCEDLISILSSSGEPTVTVSINELRRMSEQE